MNFTGTGVALVTPFTSDGRVDETSLRKLVDHVIAGGVEFLVPLGTTSEAAVLTTEEKHRVMDIILEQNNNRLPLMAGIGGNNTQGVIDSIKQFPYLDKCQAILSVTPYYNKPSQEGLYQHYKYLAQESPLPLFLYNVPGRTAVNMTAETTVRLSHDCKNIIGIKEACSDLQQVTEILRDMRSDFLLFSGNDDLAFPQIALGIHGVISVIANLFPAEYSSMVRYAKAGNYDEARKIHVQMSKLYKYLFQEGNPAGVKAGLHIRKIIHENHLRLPLVPVSSKLYAVMQQECAGI
ncbi:4-hydroxy-tetrahydrodipicolinate synthase [Odoribacter sp. OttesenSCG-928-J03]|nr:4-hydroxy-tetrahydrodipicolinate synthase [Odoribacter sp. OttesenSCG-928-J03]MDL2283194.1 4-hydroxy-tetrahydrodipicolinate synthase [Odoribacter sp. OttesenSCG-928-G04]MDL2331007.1 4-hydroxy-tetrahydrodipicolinate synthase [Odoribacter sp. OttesenSCG-928-A06]